MNTRRRMTAGCSSPGIGRCPLLAAALPLALSCGTANSHCEYEVTVLLVPISCAFVPAITSGIGLNEDGHVVGDYQCFLWEHSEAFLWTPSGGYFTLERPPGVTSASALDINDSGIICGDMIASGLGFRGFVYQDGVWTELPPVIQGNGAQSRARAISNAGVVVGNRSIREGLNPFNAFSWSAAEGITDLGVMSGGASEATDNNEKGEVTGVTGGFGFGEAFIWADGEVTLLGQAPQGTASWGTAINNDGVVAGGVLMDPDKVPAIVGQPALWQNGTWSLLGLLPGCDAGGAGDLNDRAQVVGNCRNSQIPNDLRGFLWQDGVMTDLNDLVPAELGIVIDRAKAINNAGQILTDGNDAYGNAVTFLLTPVLPLGDLDGDCHTGIVDFLMLLAQWGQSDSPADLDGDGIVGLFDFAILLDNWG